MCSTQQAAQKVFLNREYFGGNNGFCSSPSIHLHRAVARVPRVVSPRAIFIDMWTNGAAAEPGATAEYMRALKEKLCICLARSLQIVSIVNFLFMFGLCVIPRLTVSLLPVCMRFLECSPFFHFGIISFWVQNSQMIKPAQLNGRIMISIIHAH